MKLIKKLLFVFLLLISAKPLKAPCESFNPVLSNDKVLMACAGFNYVLSVMNGRILKNNQNMNTLDKAQLIAPPIIFAVGSYIFAPKEKSYKFLLTTLASAMMGYLTVQTENNETVAVDNVIDSESDDD